MKEAPSIRRSLFLLAFSLFLVRPAKKAEIDPPIPHFSEREIPPMDFLNFLMALSPIVVVLVGILGFKKSAKTVSPIALA